MNGPLGTHVRTVRTGSCASVVRATPLMQPNFHGPLPDRVKDVALYSVSGLLRYARASHRLAYEITSLN